MIHHILSALESSGYAFSTKGGNYYYRVTVDNTPDDEVKDVFVNARTGKIVQITEHPGEMMDE